jgi:hypothetical protein
MDNLEFMVHFTWNKFLIFLECDDYEKKSPYFQGKCESWCESKIIKNFKIPASVGRDLQ